MAEEKTVSKVQVAVHKAAISLKIGESISDFTRELSGAGKDHVFKKLNLDKKNSWAYMVEAFGGHVVFDVDKRGDDKGPKYYAFTYKRNKDNFEFGSLVEVQRVTTFKPKVQAVSKSVDDETLGFFKIGDWVGTEKKKKNMWSGVL